MSGSERFLYKGHEVKRGDRVKTINAESNEPGFYRVERVWGSHVIMRRITEEEAGPNPTLITVRSEAKA
jgi:hypothetical protein